MNISAIIFDFGNVINRWEPEKAFSHLFHDEAMIHQAMERHKLKEWVGCVLDAGEDIEMSIMSIARTDPDRAVFLREYVEHIELAHATPIVGTELLIRWMAERPELSIYGMTNCGAVAYEALKKNFPIIDCMKDVFVSAVEKLMKPDAAAFAALLDRNGLRAGECLFIDDAPKNVEGAKAAGMAALLFTSPEQLKIDLALYGLLIPEAAE